MEFPDKYMNSLKVLNAPKYLMYTHYDCRNLHLGLNKKAFFSDLDSHEVVISNTNNNIIRLDINLSAFVMPYFID